MSGIHTLGEALCKASELGHQEGVEHLLTLTAANFDDGRPLMNAIRGDHSHIVKILIEAGADIHVREEAPLRTAVYLNHVEVVRILVEAGADIHFSDDLALRLAVEEGHVQTAECLISRGARCQMASETRLLTTLDVAVCSGNEPMLRMLVEKGAPIDTVTETGLLEAARLGRVHTFDFLLEKGVRIDTPAVRSAAREDALSAAWFEALDVRAQIAPAQDRAKSSIRRSAT